MSVMPKRRRDAEPQTNWPQFFGGMAVVAIGLYLAISGKAGEIFKSLINWHVETSMGRAREMNAEHQAQREAESDSP
jgi:hypothetical protein